MFEDVYTIKKKKEQPKPELTLINGEDINEKARAIIKELKTHKSYKNIFDQKKELPQL